MDGQSDYSNIARDVWISRQKFPVSQPCVILPSMNERYPSADWIETVKRRGQAPVLLTLLDVIEPIAPLLAQGLWAAQPLSGLWQGRRTVQEMAECLETPEGIARLRQRLTDEAQE